MPGIDDVDRQFRRVATAPTDGELAAERAAQAAQEGMLSEAERGVREDCAAAAAAIGDKVEEVALFAADWRYRRLAQKDDAEQNSERIEGLVTAQSPSTASPLACQEEARSATGAPLSVSDERLDGAMREAEAAHAAEIAAIRDRREIRHEALSYAVHLMHIVGPFDRAVAGTVALDLARAFERYLLGGDDPPKQASAEEQLAGFGLFGLAPPKPPAKME